MNKSQPTPTFTMRNWKHNDVLPAQKAFTISGSILGSIIWPKKNKFHRLHTKYTFNTFNLFCQKWKKYSHYHMDNLHNFSLDIFMPLYIITKQLSYAWSYGSIWSKNTFACWITTSECQRSQMQNWVKCVQANYYTNRTTSQPLQKNLSTRIHS